MSTKKMLAALIVASGFVGQAALADSLDVPVPNDLIVNYGGFQWAWAGPCAPVAPSCGTADFSYQGGLGWRLPTVDEMGLYAPPVSAFGTADNFKCASAYFNNLYTHCDYSDALSGYIYNAPGGQAPISTEEFWAIRGQPASVPEPATLGMLGLGLVGAALRRRRKESVQS